MIKTELFSEETKTRKDGAIITTYLVKTYSTENKYIKQVETGVEYDIAIDIGILENGIYKPKDYTYTETNELIETINES